MFHTVLIVFANFLLVLACILLFFLPFYAWYYFRIRPHSEHSQRRFNISDELEQFLLTKPANYLIFFWAMGEALVWFVIPEFLLLLIVFMRIRRKRELLVYDIGGTVAGTIIAFMFHPSDAFVAQLPYIQEKMVAMTHHWYNTMGIWGLINQPFSGVPFKVFTLTANQHHFWLPLFVLVALFVRMSRYVIAFGIFLVLYPGLHGYVKRNYARLFVIATFIFSILLLKIVHSYR